MFNSKKDTKDNYPLPPAYSVRRATDEDISKLNYTITLPIGIAIIFGVSVAVIPIFLMVIQSSWQDWERMQTVVQLGTGTRKHTPNIEDWYRVIFVGLYLDKWLWGLITGLGITGSIIKLLVPKSKQNYQRWVATFNNQIIGQAILQEKQSYSLLMYVGINSSNWWQGVGSCLVWNSVKDAKKPLYLTCRPSLEAFYQCFGFISITKRQQPLEFRRYSTSCVMVLLNEAIPSKRSQPQLLLPAGCSIRSIENIWMRWQVYQQLWSSESFRESRFYIFKFIAVIFLPLIIGMTIIWNIAGIWDIYWLAGIISIIALLTPIFTIFIFWQDLVIQRSGNSVAYAHLSCRLKYSILYCFHIQNSYQQQQVSQAFLERLTRRIQLPIYLVCPRQDAKFYTQLGFVLINQQTLPFELQIIRFQNYVALKYQYCKE